MEGEVGRLGVEDGVVVAAAQLGVTSPVIVGDPALGGFAGMMAWESNQRPLRSNRPRLRPLSRYCRMVSSLWIPAGDEAP